MITQQIYLDHAAATPLDERVFEAMQPYLSDQFFNPSSAYEPALKVRRDYQAAKHTIAQIIGVRADELTMTAGATESINLAFHSTRGHVVTTTIEHPAVLNIATVREHTLVDVDAHGRVSPAAVLTAITDETELVSVGLANSEIGTVQPIREIATQLEMIREQRREQGNNRPLYFHSDASQGAGLLDIQVARLGVDMLTLNAAKIYGPKQVGLLYTNRNVQLTPQLVGGGQEGNRRSGTENVAGVIGFATALTRADRQRKTEAKRLSELRAKAVSALQATFPDMIVSGHPNHHLASHLHLSFPGLDGERLLFSLEARGVFVATGSACAANKGTRSHVLEAISLTPEVADGSLRLSFGHLSTAENTIRAIEILIDVVRTEKERTAV